MNPWVSGGRCARIADRRRIRCFLCISAVWSLVSIGLVAQVPAAGAIAGIVVDESSAVVANAVVTLDDSNGHARASTATDVRGAFTFTNVPPGRHVLRVQGAQFAPTTVDVAIDAVIAPARLRVVLKVGGVQETVNVQAAGGLAPYSLPTVTMASKTDTPVLQTPFSIEVIPSQAIADQQAIALSDVTKNVSGVQANWGYGREYEGFALRGFETNTTLLNGVRAAGEASRTSVDMANVEDVEVLKGPAAMLFGRLEPGGLINVITKQPLDTPQFSIQQQVGSNNLARTTVDATGPLTADGSLRYRVVGEYFTSHSFFTHAPNGKTQFVAPSLEWRPSAKFQAKVNVEYRNYDPLLADGIPAMGNRPANIPVTTWVGDAGDSGNIKKTLVNVSASYLLSPDWKVHVSAIANWQTYNSGEMTPLTLDETPGPTYGNLGNGPWFVHVPSNGRNVAVDMSGHVRTGGIDQTILVGTDYYQLNFSYEGFVNGFSPVDTINVFTPTYFRATAFGSDAMYASMPPDWRTAGTNGWNGLYAQDQLKLSNHIQVLVGGRYDWARMSAGQVLLEVRPAGDHHQGSQHDDRARYQIQPTCGAHLPADLVALTLWELRPVARRVGHRGQHRRRREWQPASPGTGLVVRRGTENRVIRGTSPFDHRRLQRHQKQCGHARPLLAKSDGPPGDRRGTQPRHRSRRERRSHDAAQRHRDLCLRRRDHHQGQHRAAG